MPTLSQEDPPPSSDVFGSYPIPYPKREFLSDEDDNEKQENKQRERNNQQRERPNG